MPLPRLSLVHGLTIAGLWASLLTAGGCAREDPLQITPPASPVTDLERSEAAALSVERELLAKLVFPLSHGDVTSAKGMLVEKSFRGVPFRAREVEGAGPLGVQRLQAAEAEADSPAAFLERLAGLLPLEHSERTEAELLRFELDPAGLRATGLARLRWAGATGAGSARADLTLFAEIEVTQVSGRWRLVHCLPAPAQAHALAPGVLLLGPPEPIYVDRTDSVGLTLGTSEENRHLIQSFIDRHLTLALGGLCVTDFNGDERPDLIATRSEETALVFLNDGESGFVPAPLPMEQASDYPAFLLSVDLDGDGLDELVASEVSRFDGAVGYAGLWTRSPAPEADGEGGNPNPGSWRHLPRALPLPVAVGMRRIAVQNVVPFDADGDGDLDLFLAVYGNAASRGEHYNTVEAHDGADNYLLMNQGGLRFTEESDERGITGTGYTYVALSFDADHDGDFDLLEGNDFGPNVLWRNDGGRFAPDLARGLGGVSAYTMGAALADLEADGTWDLYVSNMSSEEGMRMVPRAGRLNDEMRGRVDTIARGNMFYREPPGPDQPWSERAEALGVHEGEWAWGCQFVDVDGDGAQEILVTNGFASHQNPELGDWQTYYWRQVIDDGYQLQTGGASADVNASVRFQGSFNGHERDRLFVRMDGGSPMRIWVDGGYCLGFDDAHDGRAVVALDPDGDGDQDLALLTLGGLEYRENRSAAAPWTRLRLLEESGQPALGARAYVTCGGRRQARHVAIVEGFQSQVTTDLHLALGSPTDAADRGSIDRVQVVWSDGEEETFEGLPAERLLTIQRAGGGSLPVATELPRWSEGSLEVQPEWRQLVQRSSPPPSPRAVTVEVPAEPGSRGPAATAILDGDRRVLRWLRGPGDSATRDAYGAIGATERAIPRLLIQAGRIALDEARYRDALGIFTAATQGRSDLSVSDAPAFEGLARAHVLLGRTDLAEAAYRRSVQLDPDYAIGHFNLAASCAHQGRFAEAIEALLEVQRIEGMTDRVVGAMVENAGSAGRTKLAREYGGLWLEAHPGDADMLTLLGKIEARAKNYLAAKGRFEQALEIAPRHGEARAALGLTLELLGRR